MQSAVFIFLLMRSVITSGVPFCDVGVVRWGSAGPEMLAAREALKQSYAVVVLYHPEVTF